MIDRDVAYLLTHEHDSDVEFHSLASVGVHTSADAYRVQREYVRLQAKNRATRAVGYKVGLTSKVVQSMCGADGPVAGCVLADSLRQSGAVLDLGNYGQLVLEFEIAVRIGQEIGVSEPIDFAAVSRIIDAVCPALEIVDDRRCNYAKLHIPSIIADNVFNAGIVLGTFATHWPDLGSARATAFADGGVVGRGTGHDILGHPYNSIIWLAKHLAESGESLHAGDIVLTGSMIKPHRAAGTSAIRFDIEGFESVNVTVRPHSANSH